MKNVVLALAMLFGMLLGGALPALADGCYICNRDSACGQYCGYTGQDNADNRKKCTSAGCKIGGTASCPTGKNIKVCHAELSPGERLRELAVFVFGSLIGTAEAQTASLSAAEIKAIVASPERSAADRTNDLRRKPEEYLAFIAPRVGMVALDLSAGGGYTSELLARAIGPTGKVYGQSRPRPAVATPPPAPEGNSNPNLPPAAAPAAPPRPSPEALANRVKLMTEAGVKAAPIEAVVRPFEDPVPPEIAEGKVDLVTLMFNYHDLGFMNVDRAAMNRAVFKALKPGGTYVIADHSGRPGTGISESGTLHRIEEAFLRQEVEAVGFKVVAEGNFLRNPNDPRDKNTPDPPMPKDEFFLKFVKP
jgi:predicted methyltransferase